MKKLGKETRDVGLRQDSGLSIYYNSYCKKDKWITDSRKKVYSCDFCLDSFYFVKNQV